MISRTGFEVHDDPCRFLAKALGADVWHERHGYGKVVKTSGISKDGEVAVRYLCRPDGSKLLPEDVELGWTPAFQLIDLGEHP